MTRNAHPRLGIASHVLALMVCALGCQDYQDAPEVGSTNAEAPLFQATGYERWPTAQIPVCWKKSAYNETEFAEFRRLARVWLAESWSAAGNVEFTDWGVCSPFPSDNHINVYFVDEPEASAATIGYAGPEETMEINGVTYQRKSGRNGLQFRRDAAGGDSAHVTVLHEFGHALGFSHEFDRGADENCKPMPGAVASGNVWGTEYDEFSMMNSSYCNHWDDQDLTASDIAGVRRAYGGFADTQLVTAMRSDGRIEVVYNGTGNVLYHVTQNSPNSDWSRPKLLVPEAPTIRGTQMAVAQNPDGRLEVFYIGTDDRVRHTYEYLDGTWSDEFELVDSALKAKRIAAGRNLEDRLEVILTGMDDVVRHVYQLPSGGWSGVYDLVDSTVKAKRIDVGRNSDGRMEVFLEGTDSVLRHIYQYSGGGWSPAFNLVDGSTKAMALAVGTNPDGRLELFYIGTDSVLRHVFQLSGGGWSGQEYLAGSTTKARQVSVGHDQDGRIEVVFTGVDDALRRVYQKAGGGWSGVEWLVGSSSKARQLSVGRNEDGRLEVFYYGTDYTMYHTWQSSPGSAFGESYFL